MRRGAAVAVLAALTVLASAGCTRSKGEYATPSELCGVPVDPAQLKPVLLPGEKLTTTSVEPAGGTRTCRVSVDGETVLSLESRPYPPDENYRATWDWQMPNATPVDIGDEGRAIDTLVGAAESCAVKGEKQVFVARAERFYPKRDDAAARKAALVRFMTAYFPAAKKAAGCTG